MSEGEEQELLGYLRKDAACGVGSGKISPWGEGDEKVLGGGAFK